MTPCRLNLPMRRCDRQPVRVHHERGPAVHTWHCRYYSTVPDPDDGSDDTSSSDI